MTALPTACQYCDAPMTRSMRTCKACGASYDVRKTAVKSLVFVSIVMLFVSLTFANAIYVSLSDGPEIGPFILVILSIATLIGAGLAAWAVKMAFGPREHIEWTEGPPEHADMKKLDPDYFGKKEGIEA